MNNRAQVEAENIAMSYGTNVVLRDINFEIEPGEFFALLGPSGSGKSTLLRLIAGFNNADSGRLLINGVDVSRVPPWARNVGMVFQNYALWPHMTVRQNVAFGLEERKLPRPKIAEKVRAALALVNLSEYADRRPSQLSGGQQQRVALARTIAIEPQLLLLDEPLSNLDAKLRVQMRNELRSLQRKLGITTIFVTHDQEEAMTTADRIAVMHHGVIQQIGTPVDLFDNPANRFVADFVGSINLLPGRVERTSDGSLLFDCALGRFDLGHVRDASGEALIAIRPHTLLLSKALQDPERVWVQGTILEREFVGEFMRYTIKVHEQSIIADQAHHIGRAPHEPGSVIHVGIDPAQARLLPFPNAEIR
ncbi:MAG TPA: ABC transporter ATP-binding protein [Burkholderiales bacterium]|nr:ABC transporter ATP-binding protein [Burkholderiales bacterium]